MKTNRTTIASQPKVRSLHEIATMTAKVVGGEWVVCSDPTETRSSILHTTTGGEVVFTRSRKIENGVFRGVARAYPPSIDVDRYPIADVATFSLSESRSIRSVVAHVVRKVIAPALTKFPGAAQYVRQQGQITALQIETATALARAVGAEIAPRKIEEARRYLERIQFLARGPVGCQCEARFTVSGTSGLTDIEAFRLTKDEALAVAWALKMILRARQQQEEFSDGDF